MVCLTVEPFAVRINKILYTFDACIVYRRYLVAVLESTIENGYRHTFSFMANVMQTVTSQHLYLFLAIAVVFAFDTVPLVPSLMNLDLDKFLVNAVG